MSNSGNPLPIKVIAAQKPDYRPYHAGGRTPKPLCEVTPETREGFALQVEGVRDHFAESFAANPGRPLVARVTLRTDAISKSHRPTMLFGADTCPIVGGDRLGEIFVSVTPRGLDALARRFRKDERKRSVHNISTVVKIEPYTANDALSEDLAKESEEPKKAQKKKPLRVRIHRHNDQATDEAIDRHFEHQIAELGLTDVETLDYAEGIRIYRVKDATPDQARAIAELDNVQEVNLFPSYRVVRTVSRGISRLTADDFPPPKQGIEYPLVGLIDSGTDATNPHLKPWIYDRHERVPKADQDNSHGSFVAGLLVHARRLNGDDPKFYETPCRIVDVVAVDKRGEISEDQLIFIIDEVLDKYPQVRVWNMSLSQAKPCNDHRFSELGRALDDRMARYNVLFVVPTGNYEDATFRSRPSKVDIGDVDRLCPPGDSTLAITVGGLAHIHRKGSIAKKGRVSPFARRGPGPADLLKPEFAFSAGNVNERGHSFQTGIISIDGRGQVAEDVGVSFACPPAATLAATVHDSIEVDPSGSSALLTKALMVHAAFLKNSSLTAQKVKYQGLGQPPDVNEILNCTLHSATVILQANVQSRPLNQFGKRQFPMPTCLSDDGIKMRGEIYMSLLYPPPFSQVGGMEYCQCNVEASFGTKEINPKTNKPMHKRRINPTPKRITKGLERELVKNGFKWSPIKLYRAKLEDFPADRQWRLMLDVHVRSGQQPAEAQPVILIFTIRDPENRAYVYDELVRSMTARGWQPQDLKLKGRHRLR